MGSLLIRETSSRPYMGNATSSLCPMSGSAWRWPGHGCPAGSLPWRRSLHECIVVGTRPLAVELVE